MPVVGFVDAGLAENSAHYLAAFRKELGETGYARRPEREGQYHWLQGMIACQR